MFLAMAWAVIADCDINSEAIRWAGEPRFTLWGIYRVLAVRNYFGKLSFKGQDIKSNKFADLESIENY
jgi:sphingosine kinase